MAITYVQSAVSVSTQSTLTLGSAPKQNDALVALVSSSTGAPAANTGWTSLFAGSGTVWHVGVFGKIAGASESTSQQPITAAATLGIIEFSTTTGFNINNLSISLQSKYAEAATAAPPAVTSANITPAQPTSAAILLARINTGVTTDTPPTTIGSMTIVGNPFAASNGVFAYQLNIGTATYHQTVTYTGTATSPCGVVIAVISDLTMPYQPGYQLNPILAQ